MRAPVLTFFNNKGGVGKTSLVFHVAWMLAHQGRRVLVVDLDPQANLTAAFLAERELDRLWDGNGGRAGTVYECVRPLSEVGDLEAPELRKCGIGVYLLCGDLALSRFEDQLSTEWPNCLVEGPYRAFRVVSAFWQVIQLGAEKCEADIVLVDVGPSLGAINRSALIATDFVVVPLAADIFSRQGLRNLGPTLFKWRRGWKQRRDGWSDPAFGLPDGNMQPIGYLIQQHGVRLNRPVKAYDEWVRQMPAEYSRHVLGQDPPPGLHDPRRDPNCIATVKHYRSLIPLAQSVRKPIFDLTAADGALGSHAVAANDAGRDFRDIVSAIESRIRE
ncbi:MAG: AAA family ATPase [Holophagales bacterium]|nr:AAA family ATPase [Holophagales bacterium]MYF96521.1 AAA family ATPase [Holophagales bacterium]